MSKLINKLVRLEFDLMLTIIPSAVKAAAGMLPMSAPHSNAWPNTGSPRASTAIYGIERMNAAGQRENAARYLPNTICLRLVGVSSNASSVARSRSPLMLSAAMMRPINKPNVMLACSVRNNTCCAWNKLSSLLVASRNAVMDMSTLNKMSRLSARPPIHNSTNSRLKTSHHAVAPDWAVSVLLCKAFKALIRLTPL